MPVTAVTPRSHWSKEINHAVASLLDSAEWRALCTDPTVPDADLATLAATYAADVSLGRTAAEGQIVWYLADMEKFPENPANALPRVFIRHVETAIHHMGGMGFRQSGVVIIDFEFLVPSIYLNENRSDQFKNALLWGENVVGNIARQIIESRDSAAGGRLNVDHAELQRSGFYDPADTASQLVYAAELLLTHQGP